MNLIVYSRSADSFASRLDLEAEVEQVVEDLMRRRIQSLNLSPDGGPYTTSAVTIFSSGRLAQHHSFCGELWFEVVYGENVQILENHPDLPAMKPHVPAQYWVPPFPSEPDAGGWTPWPYDN